MLQIFIDNNPLLLPSPVHWGQFFYFGKVVLCDYADGYNIVYNPFRYTIFRR